MKILYILQQFPYPTLNGVRCKIHGVLSYIAKKHSCDILSFGDNHTRNCARDWLDSLPGLRLLDTFPTRSRASLFPLQAASIVLGWRFPAAFRYKTSAFTKAVRKAIAEKDYDLVHIDTIGLMYYQQVVGDIPCVLSINDAISRACERAATYRTSRFERFRWRLIGRQMLEIEQSKLCLFPAVHVVSPVDAAYLETRAQLSNVHVIEMPAESGHTNLPVREHSREVTIFSGGNYEVRHIREPISIFINQYWCELKQKFHDVRWIIVGKGASSKLKPSLLIQDHIELFDWAVDYTAMIGKADICVMLDAAGTGLKARVIQALAAGKAVVGSPSVFEGIAVEHGNHGFISPHPEDTYQILNILLESSELRERVGQSARNLISHRYSREYLGKMWEELYEKVREGALIS